MVNYTGRACVNKATGRLIEYQSGGISQECLNTLTQNAVNAGIDPNDIEEKYVTDIQFKTLIDTATAEEQAAAKAEKDAKLKKLDDATTVDEVKAAVKELIG